MQVAHSTSPVLITDRESNLQIGKDFTSNLIMALDETQFQVFELDKFTMKFCF